MSRVANSKRQGCPYSRKRGRVHLLIGQPFQGIDAWLRMLACFCSDILVPAHPHIRSSSPCLHTKPYLSDASKLWHGSSSYTSVSSKAKSAARADTPKRSSKLQWPAHVFESPLCLQDITEPTAGREHKMQDRSLRSFKIRKAVSSQSKNLSQLVTARCAFRPVHSRVGISWSQVTARLRASKPFKRQTSDSKPLKDPTCAHQDTALQLQSTGEPADIGPIKICSALRSLK